MVSINYYGVKKKLKKLWFEFYREAKGSHEVWYNKDLDKTIIVPNHWKKDIKKWTLSSIVKATWLSVKQFWEL